MIAVNIVGFFYRLVLVKERVAGGGGIGYIYKYQLTEDRFHALGWGGVGCDLILTYVPIPMTAV